jgi:serine/threonine protein kinase
MPSGYIQGGYIQELQHHRSVVCISRVGNSRFTALCFSRTSVGFPFAKSLWLQRTSSQMLTCFFPVIVVSPSCIQASAAQLHRPCLVDQMMHHFMWLTDAGVIFYEMLYGQRPFHKNVSQEVIASNNLLLNPTQLTFEAKPAISQGAKDFIQKCLTYSHQARPDAKEAAQHEYLASVRSARRAPAQGLIAPGAPTNI